MDLTNEQWEVLEPLIPDPVRQADGRDRPWRDSRDVLNGLLWFCVPALHGATCRNATRLTRRVTDASSGGTRIKRVLKRAELPPIRFHDLRHSCATIHPVEGKHPKYVQERLGHASISITLDTYSHVVEEMDGGLADAMHGAL